MNVFLPGLPFLPFRPTSPIPPRYPSEGNKDKNKSKCKPSKIQRRKNKKKRSQLQSEARMKGAKLHDEINNPQSSSPKKKKSSRQKKREKKEKEREKQLFESCQLVMKERGAQECGICLDFVDGKLNPYYGLLDCCQHVFCLKCILSWRKEKILDPDGQILDTKKECPLCRIPSTYLIPSSELITDQKEKQELFDRILKKESKKDCLFFKRSLRSSKRRDKLLEVMGEKEKGSGSEGGKVEDSKPWCPFFDDCHHRHQITPDSPPYLFNQRAGKYSQKPGLSRARRWNLHLREMAAMGFGFF